MLSPGSIAPISSDLNHVIGHERSCELTSCFCVSELRRLLKPSRLLLLNCLVLLSYTELITKAISGIQIPETTVSVSEVAQLSGWNLVDSRWAPAISELPLPASLSLIQRELGEQFSTQTAASPPPEYSSLTTAAQPTSSSSQPSKPSKQQNENPAPEASLIPPIIGDTAPSDSNASSVPSGLATPPISPHRSDNLILPEKRKLPHAAILLDAKRRLISTPGEILFSVGGSSASAVPVVSSSGHVTVDSGPVLTYVCRRRRSLS